VDRLHGLQTLSGEVLQNTQSNRRKNKRYLKTQAAVQIKNSSDAEDGSSRRKRRRIAEGGLGDMNEVSTLVDVNTTKNPARTTDDDDDEDIEIMSKIDPRLLEERRGEEL
jgi:hypothetical protein